MDAQYTTLRTLLWFVLVLVVVAILSNFYVASQLARNSNELASLRLILQKDLLGNALTESQQLQKRMDSLNSTAAGMDSKMQQVSAQMDAKMQQAQEQMDAKLKKAQDDFVARMKVELPKIMDNYVRSRAPALEKGVENQLRKNGVPSP
jgi:TolA-binding protein